MTDAQTSIFPRRTLIIIVSIAVVSFVAMVLLSILSGDQEGGYQAGAHPYSDSALGYRGLVSFLEARDVPVMVSRNQSLFQRMDGKGLQIILEPPYSFGFGEAALNFLGSGPVLLVLPKWIGTADANKPRWVSKVEPVSDVRAGAVLSSFLEDGEIVRPDTAVAWTYSEFAATPSLSRPQLIESNVLLPLIESDQGILLGQGSSYGDTFYVLADPDIMNNHGLGDGQNAALVAEMLDLLRNYDGTVVIDATLHGYTRSTNLWRTLFEMPLLPVTLLGLLAVALMFWAAVPRFGAPLAAPPRMKPGKQGLIENTAQLLDFGGFFPTTLEQYRAASVRQVAAALHAPSTLDEVDLRVWLDRIAESRGLSLRYIDLTIDIAGPLGTGAVDMRAALATARKIHRWKSEMLRGSVAN